jgi:hypothetical protein
VGEARSERAGGTSSTIISRTAAYSGEGPATAPTAAPLPASSVRPKRSASATGFAGEGLSPAATAAARTTPAGRSRSRQEPRRASAESA